MTLEQERDELLRHIKIDEKDQEKRSAYIDGVFDMYNAAKKVAGKSNGKT